MYIHVYITYILPPTWYVSWQLNGDQRSTTSSNGLFQRTNLTTGVKTQWPSEQSCEISTSGSLESFNDNKYSVTVVLPIKHKCISILL